MLKIQKLTAFLSLLGFFIGALAPSLPASAQFNPHLIITDVELTDYNTMNLDQIQEFLEVKDSPLAKYVDPTVRMTAAQIIYDNARLNRINPKYVLALLQKEQSLVTDPNPSEDQYNWATGYGICDSCTKNDPGVQKYKGFYKQVDYGAGGTRFYFDNPDKFKYQVGQTYAIDDTKVTIKNDATRTLYIYTPHLHGNEILANLWEKWFAVSYLDGTLLQDAESGGIYLIRDGAKQPFLSKSAFLSRYLSFDKVIPVKPAELDKYSLSSPIEYPNYSLLQIPTGGIYLLDDDTLRPIDSKETFKLLGFNLEEIIHVGNKDIFPYKFGEPVTKKDLHPTGTLLQDKKTGGVYFVKLGVKYPIPTRDLLKIYYKNKKITAASAKELDQYETGAAIKLRDGELVSPKGESTVYFISSSLKKPFDSYAAFKGMGFKPENIIYVDKKTLELHTTGEIITLNK
ncbi:hypothetical protein A3H03_02480 [Candidatus Kuenenbacteria bacterium RIFCSPLOWO2_12_FULL_42_13]|uniref:Curculin domain protein (Mannose-binding) lectin n=4 Tax=Candidatus Kueneniibacteriota TaxID=1752740 RepID=A0A0G0YVI1_9BACT|nr:MAG: hypothetical protein UV02_C0039G0004 [Candidatus Kuenenbacteria bacterium GW2011_GWA2_42_15]OGG89410.1 MAG: hypothetical protein A3C68_00435 [Candidatus Kuenenbacteria bacterium RIFCSPHIGHO2_02_FULL_42_29]OGG91185.1 MAG: hypothetical protein A3H55_03500 [Candidatus Kuenenbacteria bacterium RIFCSPLOWO2_02_FULL_42_16]OGG92235.1 MAG: hypothetical protein A3H03_02480 [Candidatus Kuenenbacteria bacterium RIFCSPLOWO2_12_FULL_42_13]OGG99635.1 MAG: hypothetical protein A3E04_00250 [Candidatus K